MAGDHFYTLDPAGELAPQVGYEREGIAGFVFSAAQPSTKPLFRWFSPVTGDHFYTTDPNGELAPAAGYQSEGVACFVFGSQVNNSVALHRWFHPVTGDHFYTTDPNGELAPAAGYQSEGVACWVHPIQNGGSQPLFRWFQSGMFSNFSFDAGITAQQRLRTLERHSLAYFRAKQLAGAGPLNASETKDLIDAYHRPIWHGVDTNPNNNASAIVGGSSIWINFGNLFPQGDNEIAQSLIHEMMHCAGYTHPNRQTSDVPGDGGAYYNSPPLRAELCIAGSQSDTFTQQVQADGAIMSCSVRRRSAVPG